MAYDLTALDRLVEDLGEATARDLVACFVGEVARRRDSIAAAVAAADMAVLGAEGHALKSSAAAYGARAVAALATDLEDAVKAGAAGVAVAHGARLLQAAVAAETTAARWLADRTRRSADPPRP